jgi:hypothetical protein
MTDQTQQNNQTDDQTVVTQPQQNSAQDLPFGGALPFANVPKPQQQTQVVYSGGPESGPIEIKTESAPSSESSAETKKENESIPENEKTIERKEAKPSVYPKNAQATGTNQAPLNVPQIQPLKPKFIPPKFFGYMISPQIANNFPMISTQKGKGSPTKSRTWIYMLLDRLLKKQTYTQK